MGVQSSYDEYDRKRAQSTMPARLARYGLALEDVGDLKSLHVERATTLSKPDEECPDTRSAKQVQVRDYMHLKELLGNRIDHCGKQLPDHERQQEAERLLAEITKGGKHRMMNLHELAKYFLYLDDGTLAHRIAPILTKWRLPKWLWTLTYDELIVNAGATLTIGPWVHVLIANRIVLHTGAKFVTRGTLKIDAFRMESY